MKKSEVVRMNKRQERIERFKSNAEVQRKFGDLQGCLEFRELAQELEKLEKIEQIVNEWNNDASHSFEDMCKINKILKE